MHLHVFLAEIEGLEHALDDVDDIDELTLHLVGTAEDVSIVLRETAHAGEAVQLAAHLIAIDRTELGTTERQFLI